MTRPTDDAHTSTLQQLARIPLETHLTCQICGHSLNEGDDITAYAYRAAGEPAYAIGYIMCAADTHEHPTVFARGVREYVVTGHIGTCANTQTQTTTAVLLEPTVVVTSPPTTTNGYVHTDAPTPRDPMHPTRPEPPSLPTAAQTPTRPDGGPSDEGSR